MTSYFSITRNYYINSIYEIYRGSFHNDLCVDHEMYNDTLYVINKL